jgi:hypothetical protein
LSLNSNGIFSVGFTERWASPNYSTMFGLFLDVSAVILFFFANLLVPVCMTAHYAVFPLFPVYLPSILPNSLAMLPVVRVGFGAVFLFGVGVFSNAALLAALFTASVTGELH